MAVSKKASRDASTPISAPASVGAPPSPDLSDLAAAMAAEDEESEVTKDSAVTLTAEPAIVLPAPPDAAPLYSLASAPLGAGAGDLSDGSTISVRDVAAPLVDVAEGGTVLTVVPSEEVEDLKNKVSALLDDLDASQAREERYRGEAADSAAKLRQAYEQIKLMDAQITALDEENKALRGGAPVADKPVATARPTSIPADFDLYTWVGPGVYEGLCFKLTGESLPRARGTMIGYFPKSMSRKFPDLFKAA